MSNYTVRSYQTITLQEERTLKCYGKCGFKMIGRKRKCKFINGKYYDSILMDILSEEFKESYIKNKNIK